jgi:hypothetical protein
MPRLGPRRGISLAAVAVAALAMTASSASAVTIGQLGSEADVTTCSADLEVVQPTANSGNSFVVPSTGGVTAWTLTGWRTRAVSPDQTMTMKMFRKVGDPARFMVVGHEGPHGLAIGLNTFAANLQVKSGDVLGLHSVTNDTPCAFDAPGETILFRDPSNLADGESGDFETDDPFLVNATAEITPVNAFTLGKLKRKSNGTAVLSVNVPNPGELAVSGKGVKGSAAAVAAKQVPAGTATLVIRAKGKKKAKLADTGKVTVKPNISFTPTGGATSVQARKVKLKRKQ